MPVLLVHKISTHFLIAQSKLQCHVINFWWRICCMSIRSYVCKSHSVIDPVCSNHSPHVILQNLNGETGCSHSPAVQIWCIGTRIMEIHLKSIIHVTEFIQSLTYISFHSYICLLVCEQFNGESGVYIYVQCHVVELLYSTNIGRYCQLAKQPLLISEGIFCKFQYSKPLPSEILCTCG